jgi:hypothetical protein
MLLNLGMMLWVIAIFGSIMFHPLSIPLTCGLALIGGHLQAWGMLYAPLFHPDTLPEILRSFREAFGRSAK